MAIPNGNPFQTAADNGTTMADAQRRGHAAGNGRWPGQQPSQRTTNKTKVGGGFNLNPSLNVNVTEKGHPAGNIAGQHGAQAGPGGKGTPGGDFMSNEDIRAWCEHVRKDSRNRATERAMDADHLEAVLRTIPDAHGSMSGSRARARRVARWAKKIAAAEKQIQKYAASLYGSFEREFDSNLRTVGKGRTQPNRRQPFGWH